jgi:hypothetical protein
MCVKNFPRENGHYNFIITQLLIKSVMLNLTFSLTQKRHKYKPSLSSSIIRIFLTYYSPSREADSCPDGQEIYHLLRNSKVHYRVCKSPTPNHTWARWIHSTHIICRGADKSLTFLFAAQPKEFFLDGLKKLERRSHKCVELRGGNVNTFFQSCTLLFPS